MLLENSVAVISGIGPGLGQELGKAFAREGSKVAISCRNKDRLELFKQELIAQGADVIASSVDVTKTEDCERFVAEILEAFGSIDYLINNAYNPGSASMFEDSNLDDWRQPFEVNVIGSMRMIQACIPPLKESSKASIVNVNSMVQKKLLPTQSAYATSKGALSVATKSLAFELGSYGIRANSVNMGWMWGDPVEKSLQGIADSRGIALEEVVAEVAQGIPLGFIPEDADCANAIIFLCSDMAKVITGASLDVNGGEFMP